ncbi:MAG: hypothetical protein IKA23_03950 [Akkermansia sp.]|nr:hypothetical protein [Akkermansia sp.]
MWRKISCVLAFLAFLYLLNGGMMQAWLTAADPAAVEQHRMRCYAFLGGALLAYAVFGVLLRPRSVLHFVLCSVALPLLLLAIALVHAQGCRPGWTLALVASAAYLLWRAWVMVNRM